MARAGLSVSIRDLAAAANVGIMTVSRFERGETGRVTTRSKLAGALENLGAVFIDEGEPSSGGGVGVRLVCEPGSRRG